MSVFSSSAATLEHKESTTIVKHPGDAFVGRHPFDVGESV